MFSFFAIYVYICYGFVKHYVCLRFYVLLARGACATEANPAVPSVRSPNYQRHPARPLDSRRDDGRQNDGCLEGRGRGRGEGTDSTPATLFNDTLIKRYIYIYIYT